MPRSLTHAKNLADSVTEGQFMSQDSISFRLVLKIRRPGPYFLAYPDRPFVVVKKLAGEAVMSIRRPPGRGSFEGAARRQGRFVAMVSLSCIFKLSARQPSGMPSTIRQLTEPASMGELPCHGCFFCLLAIGCSVLLLNAVAGGDDATTAHTLR